MNRPADLVSTMAHEGPNGTSRGLLIINADDWGRDYDTTERILECAVKGSVSSVSAMLFMADSERAAAVAARLGVDAGLHLNFTTPFSAENCPSRLTDAQAKVGTYLRRHSLAQAVYHPGLANAFEYVVAAQREEYARLYGKQPARVDGHHHMHLCANVLLGRLLPEGAIVRRNFSFGEGEKSWLNRQYRGAIDRVLQRRHRVTDYFFSLPPLEPAERVNRIFSLGQASTVEVETHPINPDEYRFLTGDDIRRLAREIPIASGFVLAGKDQCGNT